MQKRKNVKKPSEIISDFLDLCAVSHENFNSSKQKVENYNSKTYEWTHKLEDASDKKERNKLATAWRRELIDRRKSKDEQILWKEIHEFAISEQNKPTLKRLNNLLERQKTTEIHLSIPPEEREFKGVK